MFFSHTHSEVFFFNGLLLFIELVTIGHSKCQVCSLQDRFCCLQPECINKGIEFPGGVFGYGEYCTELFESEASKLSFLKLNLNLNIFLPHNTVRVAVVGCSP